jgi:hypothetical protein
MEAIVRSNDLLSLSGMTPEGVTTNKELESIVRSNAFRRYPEDERRT